MIDFEIASENQLLSNLSLTTYQRLSPHIEKICLTSGTITHRSGEATVEVYFPATAIFSAVIAMNDGSTAEVALIGKEGLVGLSAILGSNTMVTNSIVQVSGTAFKLPRKIIQQEFQKEGELQLLLLIYTQAYIAHISHIAACNSLHTIEQRLARFLLFVHDYIPQETIPLTQKLISSMLGVRRASITEAAISFQSRKIIQYSRGKIAIIDRFQLEEIACECYGKIKSNYQVIAQQKLLDNI